MGAVFPRPDDVLSALGFFALWLRRPRTIGAIAPSSRRLARATAAEIDFSTPGVVVELGGGTGSITQALLARAPHPDDIVVVEREASLCRQLAARFPGVRVLHGDARSLKSLLEDEGIGPVKAIVSGLPLRSLTARCRDAIIAEAFAVLAPGGVFVQFTYGLAGPVPLVTAGADTLIGQRARWIFRNLPPAALWRYRRRADAAAKAAGQAPIAVAAPRARPESGPAGRSGWTVASETRERHPADATSP